MDDFKTSKAYESLARCAINNIINNYINVYIDNKRVVVKADETAIQLLARQFIDVYTGGVNDKCAGVV